MKYDWKTAEEKWEKAEEHVQGSGRVRFCTEFGFYYDCHGRTLASFEQKSGKIWFLFLNAHAYLGLFCKNQAVTWSRAALVEVGRASRFRIHIEGKAKKTSW